MSRDTYTWVVGQIETALGVAPDSVTRQSRFADDLDLDSIDLIEIVNRAEAEFGFRLEEEDLYEVETVEDFVSLLDTGIGA